MNAEERDRVVARYLAGDLSAGEKQTFLEELQADPEFARDAAGLVLTERLLHLEQGGADPETFHRELVQRLNLPSTGGDFARDVMGRVQAETNTPRRRSSLRHLRGQSMRSAWLPAVLAAALLLGFVLLVALSVSSPDTPSPRNRVVREGPVAPEVARPAPERPRVNRLVPEVPALKSPRPPQPGPARPRPTKLPEAPERTAPERPRTDLRPQPAPPPKRNTPAPAPTRAAVARIEAVVEAYSSKDGTALKSGQTLQAGHGIDVRQGGRAVVVFQDGTRFELGAETRMERIALAPAKKARVERGVVTARVVRQPAGRPLVLATPHAEAQVLGTVLTLSVGPESTRLVVEEGKVRLMRLADRRSVVVTAGHQAVAAPGKTLASIPLRSRRSLEALYPFDGTARDTIADRSGHNYPLTVSRPNSVVRTKDGVKVELPVSLTSQPTVGLVEACRRSGEVTIEAWIKPDDLTQVGPARIVSLALSGRSVCFMLGMNGNVDLKEPPLMNFVVRLRTTETTENGTLGDPAKWIPVLASPPNTAKARWTHLVFTRNGAGRAALYVDGVERARAAVPGSFDAWDAQRSRLTIANSLALARPWLGEIGLVAIYSRAIAPAEVVRNFRAGPRGLR